MKHPASWDSNIARRTYLVLAFPIIVFVILFLSILIETYYAIKQAYNEVKYTLGLTKHNIIKTWKGPMK